LRFHELRRRAPLRMDRGAGRRHQSAAVAPFRVRWRVPLRTGRGPGRRHPMKLCGHGHGGRPVPAPAMCLRIRPWCRSATANRRPIPWAALELCGQRPRRSPRSGSGGVPRIGRWPGHRSPARQPLNLCGYDLAVAPFLALVAAPLRIGRGAGRRTVRRPIRRQLFNPDGPWPQGSPRSGLRCRGPHRPSSWVSDLQKKYQFYRLKGRNRSPEAIVADRIWFYACGGQR